MLVDNGKMSKSLGNTYTISQLEGMGYSPLVFRYFCLNAHYRKKLNFTFEGLDAAKVSYERLCALISAQSRGLALVSRETLASYKTEFDNAVKDDVNIPMALGVLWKMVKEPLCSDVYRLALEMDKIFGLSLDNVEEYLDSIREEVPQNIASLADARIQAKAEKNWAEADRIRGEIVALGYNVLDKKDGYDIKKI